MNTYWTNDKYETGFPVLNTDLDADALIIGGGLAGLMCAHELCSEGKKVCVIEADKIGGGETSGSSAMVTFAHDLIYSQLISKHGMSVAKEYYRLANYGLEKIRGLAKESDCGYRECDFIFFATSLVGAYNLHKEKKAYDKLGISADFTDDTELPFPITEALRIKNQFCVNPCDFVKALAINLSEKGVRIFEHTPVTSQPKNGLIKVGGFSIKAENFIIATHFPYIDFPGHYFLKMYQSRSHNVVFEGNMTNMYESAENDGYEFRPAYNGVLCGGGSVRTGKSNNSGYYDIIKKHILRVFGDSVEIKAKFSAQDCITYDLLPFAGHYGGAESNTYVVTGFNKWGFTSSAACAMLIADAVKGKKNRNIFDTSRTYFCKSPFKTLFNASLSAAELINVPLSADAKKLKRIECGQGAIVRYKGNRLGVYRTPQNELKIVRAVCPHLGCALKWNKEELSWDCPCHGSRFDVDGALLSNPALSEIDNLNGKLE